MNTQTAAADVEPGARRARLGLLSAHGFNLASVTLASFGAVYMLMCLKTVATGVATYGYADFHPLWASGVLTHDGVASWNYDSTQLHVEQIRLGIDPHHENPFPYPPTFLLMLAPLGALPVGVAYWLFMIASLAAFVASMSVGRSKELVWPLAALCAPASGIAIAAGQTGFLSAALMIGGWRLAATRPWLSGVMFGLLTYKPQLGLLIPIALLAARLWKPAAAAALTVAATFLISSLAFGFEVWPAWAHQLIEYSNGYDAAYDLMPTIFANLRSHGALPATALQGLAAVAVAVVIWRAFRAGVDARGLALLTVGTFLATPHAFNYDMPMMAAASAFYVDTRVKQGGRVAVAEFAVVAAAALIPFALLAGREAIQPWSWVPIAAFFVILANLRGSARDVRP